jgi:hypothetical protein
MHGPLHEIERMLRTEERELLSIDDAGAASLVVVRGASALLVALEWLGAPEVKVS